MKMVAGGHLHVIAEGTTDAKQNGVCLLTENSST